MRNIFCSIKIEDINNLINIFTPIILLFWFYYSQKLKLSKNYFEEINGLYGGFLKPKNEPKKDEMIDSGIIMNIRDIDGKGFFKGEFDFAETLSKLSGDKYLKSVLTDGIYQFFGEMRFKFHLNKKRHPFRVKKNRKYTGKMYVVNRLDFDIKNYDIKDYLVAEYKITHFREMEVLKFKRKKVYQNQGKNLQDVCL